MLLVHDMLVADKAGCCQASCGNSCGSSSGFKGVPLASVLAAHPRGKIQGGKKNPNPNFLVRIFSSGVGVFHVTGWGPKSSIRPSKPGKSNFLGGVSRDFAGISRGRTKSLRKKVCVQFPFPKDGAVCVVKLFVL